MKLLQGKTAIITGGAKGIGRAIASNFAKHGAHVAITYRSSSAALESLENEITSQGVRFKAYQSDASSYEQSQQLVAQVMEEFGQIDVLVNNAGITRDNLLLRMSEEDFDSVVNINLKSVFNLTKAVQSVMLKQRKGSIINMSSVVGVKGNKGQANYAASKAGIIGFTKSIALELGSRNIRCNAVAPGFIETDMTAQLDAKVVQEWRETIPLKRGGTPDDVAHLCVFLGSNLSDYITGQVIHVDGGMLT